MGGSSYYFHPTRPQPTRSMDPHVAEENIQALEDDNSMEHHDPEALVAVVSAEEAEELSHPPEEVEELTEEELLKQELLNSWKEEQSASILDEVEHQIQVSEEEKAKRDSVVSHVPAAHTIIENIERSSEEAESGEVIPKPLSAAVAQPDTASSSDHIVTVPVVGKDAVDSTFRQGEDVHVIEKPRAVPLATESGKPIETVEKKVEAKAEEATSAVKSATKATEEKAVEKKEEVVDAVKSAAPAFQEYVTEKKDEVVDAAKSVARSVEEQVPEKQKQQAASALHNAEEKVKSAASTTTRKLEEVTKTVKKEVQSVPQSQLNWGLVITGVVACTVVGGLIYYYNKNK